MDDAFDNDHATFGDRVAAAREAAGMTQAQLAKRLGVKTNTVAMWEDDRNEPRANRLQMMAGLMNVSMGWLLSGIGEGARPEAPDKDATEALAELRAARKDHERALKRLRRVEDRLAALLEKV